MKEWYERSFGRDYLVVYKHRDFQGAAKEVHQMMEWLELSPAAMVLDLCCGMGRHSLALAEVGYKVTGVDLSEVLLKEAIKQDEMHAVTFLSGDMRELPVSGPFDAVVNLFTSFGYFQVDKDNGKVFHEINRVLRPGGRFIIDFLNPSYVSQHLVPESERRDEEVTIQERRFIEDGFVKKEITLTDESTGERRHYEEIVRLYELADFHSMIEQAGLHMDRVYGGYDGSLYDEFTSSRMIMVGSRPE
ncbi:methyltransferase domain-containing protein [Paenibacillus alvei]|uniref:Methyltransferase domain-containing protein n=2 Tax=Paenibacillus TaxID=44249 RepID=A0ABT4H757_PAEAL|nr:MULTISPECIES: class I SAM-dependent methyltransferase [Paenibacillus]MCY7485384.1 methyltransferase domain-containing protein [Paenibacillus alvei]MCY9764593.1 methyltransferase domain-containing protein [Paenibacillus alvei]MCY9766831.1 methyltransferase domain-containing protein [Paenibacillus alvei]